MGLKINQKAKLIPRIIGWVLAGILVIFMIKILVWENNYYKTKSEQTRAETVPVLTVVEHSIAPGEQELDDNTYANFQSEADMPRYLKIERLGVKTIVRKSEMSSYILPMPDNIYETLWYAGSSRPGQGRNVIISGISTGATKDGVFKNLDSLEKGDEIKIENGNGFEYTYEVAEIRLIEESKMNLELIDIQKQIEANETLSLVTTNANSKGEYDSVAAIRATLKKSTQLEQ